MHLVELASAAAPDDRTIQSTRSAVLQKTIDGEDSLMGKAFLSAFLRKDSNRTTQ